MKKNLITVFLVYLPIISFGQLENVTSTLEVFDVKKNERTTIYQENDHFEAPNWSKDGKYMILNGRGKIFRLDLQSKEKIYINTDFADKLNNDHGISPDGKSIVISHYDQPNVDYKNRDFRTSRIYTLPIEGGTPKIVTNKTPSFWHGWSPDGNTLIYTALRNDNFDIYAININGGEEIRLTDDAGLDDGSDFSADGKHIYYNSMQSGKMEIWRMDKDGNNKTQITDDEFSNWFPHPSPNGDMIVFLSYLEDQGSAHPAMKKVALRLMSLADNSTKTLCYFTGGQGTINVPSWSPDGSKFAFVSYQENRNPLFDADFIYAFVDGEMPATGYIDGQIQSTNQSSNDEMAILKSNGNQFERIGTISVSNSVRRWPNSTSLKIIDGKKYILIAEQDGKAAKGATKIQEISKATLLTLLDVTQPESPQILDSIKFDNIPTCVAFHPSSNLFALTFLGSNAILSGKINNGKLEIVTETNIELREEKIPAIPHFTWHPNGEFAAISLAGNDKLMFLKFNDNTNKFEQWGNVIKTPPLPGVGYFTKDGDFYIQTVINLIGDLEQDAYKDNTSLLNIYRFDDDEIPNSLPTRNNDGTDIYSSPKVKHTISQNIAFGDGYVETFAISPDDKYIVGLNMRGSWLPKDRKGNTEHSSLELFSLSNGKAKRLGSFPYQAVLPECILFDKMGNNLAVANFDTNNGQGKGSLIFWHIEEKNGKVTLMQREKILFPRGLHFLMAE